MIPPTVGNLLTRVDAEGVEKASLTEETVLQALEETISRIKRRNLTGALDTLIYLDFEQRLLPGKDPRSLLTLDRGRAFGAERVRETAERIRLCEEALRKLAENEALAAATAALARWQQR